MNRPSQNFTRSSHLLLTCALLWLAAPATTGAQEAGAYPPEPGDRIRVIPVDGELIQGRLMRLDSSSLVVSVPRDAARLIRAEEVGEVWIAQSRVGSFAKGGAIVGGVATGAAGIALMGAFCSGSTDCNSGETFAGALIGGAAGAAGGAIVGALVGAMAPRWVRADPGFDRTGARPSASLDVRFTADTGMEAPLGPVLVLSLSLPALRSARGPRR